MRHRIFTFFVVMVAGATAYAQQFEDFDGNGNTTYDFSKSDPGNTAPAEINESGNTFVRLADSDGDNNALSFDEFLPVSGPTPRGKILSFDFRMSDGLPGGFVGGMGAGYFAGGPWGVQGPRNPGVEDANNDWESPRFGGAVTLGFQPILNSISLNGFGNPLAEETAPFDINNGNWHRAIFTAVPNPNNPVTALLDVDLLEDVNGAAIAHNLMTDVPATINMAGLPPNRVMAGARGLDAALFADIDNVRVDVIPEPGAAMLIGLAAFALASVGGRRLYRM